MNQAIQSHHRAISTLNKQLRVRGVLKPTPQTKCSMWAASPSGVSPRSLCLVEEDPHAKAWATLEHKGRTYDYTCVGCYSAALSSQAGSAAERGRARRAVRAATGQAHCTSLKQARPIKRKVSAEDCTRAITLSPTPLSMKTGSSVLGQANGGSMIAATWVVLSAVAGVDEMVSMRAMGAPSSPTGGAAVAQSQPVRVEAQGRSGKALAVQALSSHSSGHRRRSISLDHEPASAHSLLHGARPAHPSALARSLSGLHPKVAPSLRRSARGPGLSGDDRVGLSNTLAPEQALKGSGSSSLRPPALWAQNRTFCR